MALEMVRMGYISVATPALRVSYLFAHILGQDEPIPTVSSSVA